jgi:hypothetical protein
MKLLTIAIVAVMLALPASSHAMASKHDNNERGAGQERGAGRSAGYQRAAPVKVPEPGSFLLLATGLTTVGGYLARKWYVTKKRGKRLERHER